MDIVWVDLESTGLDANKGSIIEIAMVATDANLNEIGKPFTSLIRPLPGFGYEVMDKFVREMHTKNGLLETFYDMEKLLAGGYSTDCLREGLPYISDVQAKAVDWCKQTLKDKMVGDGMSADAVVAVDVEKVLKGMPLGGSSVHFDRTWLRAHMPELEYLFSHRHMDTSCFTEEAKRQAPETYRRRPGLDKQGKPQSLHRALCDIRMSIETMRYYRRNITWSFPEDVVGVGPA